MMKQEEETEKVKKAIELLKMQLQEIKKSKETKDAHLSDFPELPDRSYSQVVASWAKVDLAKQKPKELVFCPQKSKDLLLESRKIVGLSPITHAEVATIMKEHKETPERARVRAFKDFLYREMGFDKPVLEALVVVNSFSDIQRKTVYLKFEYEEQANWIWEYSYKLKDKQKILSFIHQPFIMRFKAIEALAYQVRKEGRNMTTRIIIGDEDFNLQKSERGTRTSKLVKLPSTLPTVSLKEIEDYIPTFSRWSLSSASSIAGSDGRSRDCSGTSLSDSPRMAPLNVVDPGNRTEPINLRSPSAPTSESSFEDFSEEFNQTAGIQLNSGDESEPAQQNANEEGSKTYKNVPDGERNQNKNINTLQCSVEDETNMVPVLLNEQHIHGFCDSGSEVTTIPEEIYKRYKNKFGELKPTATKIRPYGAEMSLTVIGEIEDVAVYNDRGRMAIETIYVVEACSGTKVILSDKLCKSLGFIRFSQAGAPPEQDLRNKGLRKPEKDEKKEQPVMSVQDFGKNMKRQLEASGMKKSSLINGQPQRNYGTRGLGYRQVRSEGAILAPGVPVKIQTGKYRGQVGEFLDWYRSGRVLISIRGKRIDFSETSIRPVNQTVMSS